MSTADVYGDLIRLGRPIITTREAAARLRTSVSNASHRLGDLEDAGLVVRIRRGLWSLQGDVDPYVVPPSLTAPFPAYVSFWSALARHGMIEQIPRSISVASLDRARRIRTSVGDYEIRHLAPELFGGFEGSESTGYLATPAKALFDTVYVRAAGVRGGGGARTYLPELSLPPNFDPAELDHFKGLVRDPRLRTMVSRGLNDVLGHATEA